MLKIRPAETADHEDVVQLWHQGWHDAHADIVPSEVLAFRTKDHFTLWLKEGQDAFFVATDDTGVLGFVSVTGLRSSNSMSATALAGPVQPKCCSHSRKNCCVTQG
jgi:hypothetical protein